MKKNLLICLLLMSILFVACKKENIGKEEKEEKKEVKNVICNLGYHAADFLFTMLEPTIKYMDESGNEKTELLTSIRWQKKLTFSTFPVNLKVRVFYKSRNMPLTEEKYNFLSSFGGSYTIEYTDGTFSTSRTLERSSMHTIVKQQLFDRWLERNKDKGFLLLESEITLINDGSDANPPDIDDMITDENL